MSSPVIGAHSFVLITLETDPFDCDVVWEVEASSDSLEVVSHAVELLRLVRSRLERHIHQMEERPREVPLPLVEGAQEHMCQDAHSLLLAKLQSSVLSRPQLLDHSSLE